jgi:hypothetical protein
MKWCEAINIHIVSSDTADLSDLMLANVEQMASAGDNNDPSVLYVTYKVVRDQIKKTISCDQHRHVITETLGRHTDCIGNGTVSCRAGFSAISQLSYREEICHGGPNCSIYNY